MSYRKYEIIDYYPPSPFFTPEITTLPSPFNPFSLFPVPDPTHPFYPVITDLLQIEETTNSFCPFTRNRVIKQNRQVNLTELYLKSISDRVSSLESSFDRLLAVKEKEKQLKELDRKYTWTAEIKNGGGEKKYKWTAEIEGDDAKKGKNGERKYTWRTEIKGKKDGEDDRSYTWQAAIGGEQKKKEKKGIKEKNKKSEKGACGARNVEIEEEPVVADHRAIVLRQAFAKRAAKGKGKKKELSPWDAAALIQMTFRAYLVRRSQILRALRELAVAKTKLKELRSCFHNFSFRNRISRDAEECQKFSEKIIVLLLTVDAIEGVDMMVRATKRSMVDELEAMLDVVDPQQPGKSLSMRRTFDMPSGAIQKEIAEGVAQVVQMLDEESSTSEASV